MTVLSQDCSRPRYNNGDTIAWRLPASTRYAVFTLVHRGAEYLEILQSVICLITVYMMDMVGLVEGESGVKDDHAVLVNPPTFNGEWMRRRVYHDVTDRENTFVSRCKSRLSLIVWRDPHVVATKERLLAQTLLYWCQRTTTATGTYAANAWLFRNSRRYTHVMAARIRHAPAGAWIQCGTTAARAQFSRPRKLLTAVMSRPVRSWRIFAAAAEACTHVSNYNPIRDVRRNNEGLIMGDAWRRSTSGMHSCR